MTDYMILFNWDILCTVLPSLSLIQPTSCEEKGEEVRELLAALVVCVPGLVLVAVHQWSIHFLHPVVWF